MLALLVQELVRLEGTHPYTVRASAAKNLSKGEFRLTRAGNQLRLGEFAAAAAILQPLLGTTPTDVLIRAYLALALVGTGDAARALAEARKAVTLAEERGLPVGTPQAFVALARATLLAEGVASRSGVEQALGRAEALAGERGLLPVGCEILQARAALARALGDEAARASFLVEAERRYTDVYNAAWDHLVSWARDVRLPPVAPRMLFAGSGIVRDSYGNALGGIRLSEHEVATAENSATNRPADASPGSLFCGLFATHVPFSAEQLAALYRNHGRYVSQVARVHAANVAAGFLLPADSEASTAGAAESPVGRR